MELFWEIIDRIPELNNNFHHNNIFMTFFFIEGNRVKKEVDFVIYFFLVKSKLINFFNFHIFWED